MQNLVDECDQQGMLSALKKTSLVLHLRLRQLQNHQHQELL